MAVLLGATVVHDVRVNERRGVGLTACGIAFTLDDMGYDPNGRFESEYLDWLGENPNLEFPSITSLCSHCPNRQPAWEKKHKRNQAIAWAK
jgi:hypothetical protein